MVAPSPVLIISDAPSASTGLGRITREVATREAAHLLADCRVATLGCSGPGSRKLNFYQYAIEGMSTNGSDFMIPNLPEVWQDWAGNEPGVILCIWDASRLGWFSRPNVMCENPALRQFLTSAKIKRWIYVPVDAEGPEGRLAYPIVQSLLGFDRVLAYGEFGEGVLRRALGEEAALERGLSSISHGIDTSVFFPRDRVPARLNFFALTGATSLDGKRLTAILGDELLIGTIATNQARKDWALWAKSCSLFLANHPNARFWIHTDQLERPYGWSIPQLLVDFALLDRTVISIGYIEDDNMARAYSACDLTLGIGMAEGWGFPLAESLACGTPVVHVNYGGGADIVDEELLVDPIAFHYEGLYCSRRPIVSATDFAVKMTALCGKRASLNAKFNWENVWPQFETWIKKGLKQC